MKLIVNICPTPTQMFTDRAVMAVPSLDEKRMRVPQSIERPAIMVPGGIIKREWERREASATERARERERELLGIIII